MQGAPESGEPGGDGGIRTLDRALQPYNGLANRRLQPLGHVSGSRISPRRKAAANRVAQICPTRNGLASFSRDRDRPSWVLFSSWVKHNLEANIMAVALRKRRG